MLHWPGRRQLCVSVMCGLAVFCLFALVYGGANWLAGQHGWRVALHTPLDLTIPFIPAMTPVYLSLTPLLWVMAFVLRSTAEVVAFVGTMAVATLVAGVCFVLLAGRTCVSGGHSRGTRSLAAGVSTDAGDGAGSQLLPQLACGVYDDLGASGMCGALQ